MRKIFLNKIMPQIFYYNCNKDIIKYFKAKPQINYVLQIIQVFFIFSLDNDIIVKLTLNFVLLLLLLIRILFLIMLL